MNSIFKTPLLVVVLGLALQPKLRCAETSSASNSAASEQNAQSSAKSSDQRDAKASTEGNVRGDSPSDANNPTQTRRIKDNPPYHEATDTDNPVAAPQGPALFKLIDTDKDGRISQAEFIAYGTAPDARKSSAVMTAPGGNVYSDSSSGSAPSNASPKSDAAKTAHSDHQPAAVPKPDAPGAGILTSTDTRAGKYTAEVFEILDINHDKFLTQAELDALIPAHQISQP